MIRLVAFTAFLFLLVACNRKAVPTQASSDVQTSTEIELPKSTDTVLYYSRGACFGMCPIFELTVWKDGRAAYVGKNHVDRIGRFQSNVSYGDIQHVLKKAREIGYFELSPVYDNDKVHDLPDIITGIAQDGSLHRVRNRYKGPASLRMLYAELDTLIEHQNWKPTGANQE